MASHTHCVQPFTKQALLAIFNRHSPLFSYATKLKTDIQVNTIDNSININDHNLSFREYIEQQFYNVFNNYYDQYDNMTTNSYLSQDNQYVWAQKQHILIADVIFDTNNIDFIKCISSVEKSQFEFLTLTYDHLIYDNIIEKISISFSPNQHYLNETKQVQDKHNYGNNLSTGIFGSSKTIWEDLK